MYDIVMEGLVSDGRGGGGGALTLPLVSSDLWGWCTCHISHALHKSALTYGARLPILHVGVSAIR